MVKYVSKYHKPDQSLGFEGCLSKRNGYRKRERGKAVEKERHKLKKKREREQTVGDNVSL